jgi:DNA-binding NtrC family response regulator
VSSGAERLLIKAPWPGNVRELRNTLERACMLCDGRILSDRDVLSALGRHTASAPESRPDAESSVRGQSSSRRIALDRERVAEVLQQVGGNRSAAARKLGVSRRALYRRLDSFGLR